MAEYYTLQVAGLTRKLKRCRISDKLEIAAFILFSDVELTVACAKELAEKCADCNYDYIMTAESKGIPLAYELSRQTGKPYVVARKSIKGYMTDCILFLSIPLQLLLRRPYIWTAKKQHGFRANAFS